MRILPSYHFTLSVSEQSFPEKPKSPSRITFTSQNLDIEGFTQRVLEGRAFCYSFNGSSKDGKLYQTDRRKENFLSTSAIFFDFDKMTEPMDRFIEKLQFKPSVAYTTYSNGKDGKRAYRLIYCMDGVVASIDSFDCLYGAIINANGFNQLVDENGKKYGLDARAVNQMYYGSSPSGTVFSSNLVYTFSDFSIFSSPDLFPFENKTEGTDTLYSQLENQFKKDFMKMNPMGFIDKYHQDYYDNYLASLSTPLTLSDDRSYYIYPDDYQEVYRRWIDRKVVKWKVGEDRKKRLYITAQVMKHNLPSLSNENLLYNLVVERSRYYDNSDGKLTNKLLLDTVQGAMTHDFELKPCKHPEFSINKDYWLKGDMTPNQAKQIVAKRLRWEKIEKNYDHSLSVKENLARLKDMGMKVGKSTIYKYLQERE